MNLYIMTDLEGVAGIINGRDYLYPDSRYHQTARRLLTDEVNAAIAGFADGGFDNILVADGHGAGAIDITHLDPRARLSRGWPAGAYPFALTRDYDAVAYVGQHAKAGTPYSHLTHTGSFIVRDQLLNDRSIGEFGEGAFCAGELDVPIIFGSGEQAFCNEVNALTPWAITCSVLEGIIPGSGDDLDYDAYARFHEGAIHLQPQRACELIRETAKQAADRFAQDRAAFRPLKLDAPYRLVRHLRPTTDAPARTDEREHPDSIIDLFRNQKG